MCQLIFQWIDLLSNEAKLVSFLQSFLEFSKQMYILNLQRGIYNKATFPKLRSLEKPQSTESGSRWGQLLGVGGRAQGGAPGLCI